MLWPSNKRASLSSPGNAGGKSCRAGKMRSKRWLPVAGEQRAYEAGALRDGDAVEFVRSYVGLL